MGEKLAEALKKKGENGGEGQASPATEVVGEQTIEPSSAPYDEQKVIEEAGANLARMGLQVKMTEEEDRLYSKLPAEKRTSFVVHVAEKRADEEEKEKRKKERETRRAAKAPAAESDAIKIPLELANIFGDKVPQRVLRMYGGLTDSRTKEAVIAQLTADEEKRKRREERRAARAAEIPPVSAASEEPPVVPQAAEVPIEEEVSMQTADVDESGMRTPQYDRRKMQEEMDRLSRAVATSPEPGPSFEPEPEPEQREVDVPGEEREKLRVLLDKLERLSRDESNEQAARAESAETVSPSFAERSERLNERSAALDTEAVKRGWLGRVFHSLNEKWNKLSPLKKFGVTVAAGAGAAAFSWPAIFALLF